MALSYNGLGMARKRRNGNGRTNGVGLYEELGASGFSRAFHSHIEELAYEMLKDPEYQEWMKKWLEGFFELGLKKLRSRKVSSGK